VGVVKGSELVVHILRNRIGTKPHIGNQIGMRVIDARIEDGDDDFAAALRLEPRFEGRKVRALFAAVLSGVRQSPLFIKQRIVRNVRIFGLPRGRIDRYVDRFGRIELDHEIRFGVFDQIGQLIILSGDLFRIGVVEIVDRDQIFNRFDLIFDTVVVFGGDFLNFLQADVLAKLDQNFRRAVAARTFRRQRFFPVSSLFLQLFITAVLPTADLAENRRKGDDDDGDAEMYPKIITIHNL
jgi:hypothetical protein